MKKKLIITAHDFGYFDSINRGIIYSLKHKNNIITELSLLANTPGSLEAAKFSRSTKISVSLNTNFTSQKPLSRGVPSLVGKDGNFLKVDTKTWDFSVIDRFNEKDVTRELDAQWDWFTENVGRKPSAILSKKNEYVDPKILMPVVSKAKKEGVPIRVPVWMWKENYGAQSYVEQEGVKSTQNIFLGLKEWKGKFGYDLIEDIDQLIADIKTKEGVSELLVFPGFVDKELMDKSTLNWQRGQFLQVLDNNEVISKIKDNFELISFRDL